MKTHRAFFGEFGIKVCYHAPAVYALPRPYCMEIEPGDEALYPGATVYRVVDRFTGRRPGGHHWSRTGLTPDSPKRRFVPEPFQRQGTRTDVVICPRQMAYGASKNWDYWPQLAYALRGAGLDVFAAGALGSSQDVPGPKAWDYERCLDASIEAIRSARLVVATDAGLAHLAVLCGAPLLMLTHHGRVAPGPVVDEHGAVTHPEYWGVYWHRYHEGNHRNTPIVEVSSAWDRPDSVARSALSFLEQREAA